MKIIAEKGNFRIVEGIGRHLNLRYELQKCYTYYDVNKYSGKLEKRTGYSVCMISPYNPIGLLHAKEAMEQYIETPKKRVETPFSAFNNIESEV